MVRRHAFADAVARTWWRIVGVALIGALCAPVATQAIQAQNYYDLQDRYEPYDRPQNPYERLARLDPDTFATVRTRQPIDTDRGDGRVFGGVVDRDVWDDYRRLAIPAIPRGSPVELIVRSARDGDLILDLDSVVVGGGATRWTRIRNGSTRASAGATTATRPRSSEAAHCSGQSSERSPTAGRARRSVRLPEQGPGRRP